MSSAILSLRIVFDGWCRLSVARVAREEGRTFERLIEDHGRAVCVLPYDGARRTTMLVRQFRAPVCATVSQTELLEALAGLTDGEPPETAARREAFEETGLRLASLEHVGTFWTMPGLSTERMDLFLAAYAETDRIAGGGGRASENEAITVTEMPLATVAAMADSGRLDDLKTLALIQTLRLRRPSLF
jgi:nudix-type nucleoside diphosphatase (YffH/AdpP family)